MLSRGEFIKKRLLLDLNSKGFPVDGDLIMDISKYRDGIVKDLQPSANDTYGVELYRERKGAKLSFVNAALGEVVDCMQIPWDRTRTGKFKVQQDYLKQQAIHFPDLYQFYQTQKTIQTMRSSDLAVHLKDGHVKPSLYLFAQKASRESPRSSQGFILNLPKWQRCLIKPNPGEVLIAADWSQQEIAIAGG